jgi:hypothetical protein
MSTQRIPELNARFVLKDDGKPEGFISGKLTHYWVELFISDAPAWAVSASYTLHPTFVEPKRKVLRGAGNFEDTIGTYGDFEIAVKLRGKDDLKLTFSSWLSEALRRVHGNDSSKEIQSALDEIASN